VSFLVENVPALLATLKAAGVTVDTDGGEALSVGGWLRAFIRDPNGLLIELVEDRDRRWNANRFMFLRDLCVA